jgi:uncharacterized membrane protein
MGYLRNVGRLFFGATIAVMGLITVCYNEFPYMLFPPWHFTLPGFTYVLGIVFVVAGAAIILQKKVREVSVILGWLFLLIFFFCHVPYQVLVSPNFKDLEDWENATKELEFAGGAFVLAGCYPAVDRSSFMRFLAKLIPYGAVMYALPIIHFGVLHFLLAKDVANYVPSWIPFQVFWVYAGGVGLLGGGISIILNIKRTLFATMLGVMILIWFVILHLPRVIVAAPADRASEIISAFLALGYSGIAFIIAGLKPGVKRSKA